MWVAQSVINWTVVGQLTKLTIHPTLDGYSLQRDSVAWVNERQLIPVCFVDAYFKCCLATWVAVSWVIYVKQLSVQPSPRAVNTALPAFGAERRAADPCCRVPLAGDQAVSKLLLRCCNGTDGRTPCYYIDSAPHTVRAFPMIFNFGLC